MSGLPPGFTLDQPAGLPPGFTLDEGKPKRSIPAEIGRQTGLTGRAIAGGLAQTVEPFTEPLRYLFNTVLPGNPIGNIETATDEVLTSAGVPEPENNIERGVQTAGRFVASLGAGAGLTKGAEKLMGIKPPAPSPAPPNSEQLKAYANAAYKAADDSGVVISPKSFKGLVNRVNSKVTEEGIDATLHPRATAALKRLRDVGDGPVEFKQLEILRRVVKNASSSIQADERRIGQMMSHQIDDYVRSLNPKDVVAGDAETAASAISAARNLWSRMSKSETVEKLIERAGIRAQQFSGSGFENALRTEFRQLAMSEKKIRMFSPDEQAAIVMVAKGGAIENALRMLGKAAPTGIVSSVLSSGAGYAAGGPAGAIVLPAAGLAARRGATAMTSKNAQLAAELMRRGAPAAAKTIPQNLPSAAIGGIIGLDDPFYRKY